MWVSWRHLLVKLQQIPREIPGLEKLVQRNCSSEEYLGYPVKMAIINRKRIPPTIRSVWPFFSTYGMPAFHFRVTPITSALKAQIKHTGTVWQHLNILSEKANCLLRALPIISLSLSYMFSSWNKFWENHSSFPKHMVQADREGNNWKPVRQPNPSLVHNLPALPCPCAHPDQQPCILEPCAHCFYSLSSHIFSNLYLTTSCFSYPFPYSARVPRLSY